jgi:hypothetical protein
MHPAVPPGVGKKSVMLLVRRLPATCGVNEVERLTSGDDHVHLMNICGEIRIQSHFPNVCSRTCKSNGWNSKVTEDCAGVYEAVSL